MDIEKNIFAAPAAFGIYSNRAVSKQVWCETEQAQPVITCSKLTIETLE